jgi:hypothetical protein
MKVVPAVRRSGSLPECAKFSTSEDDSLTIGIFEQQISRSTVGPRKPALEEIETVFAPEHFVADEEGRCSENTSS